ncbi:MAG: hypothetical protein KJ725_19580 [Gammaproteobacteria bacterium]|jgi:hypothetical protein|uniref:hypothetical protein n=1 Tax=Methylotuvimicrobium sp. TaxID=2822413 RepID=UPI001DC61600|nr:hypothetical protein [Gammaproteobacteria bacterium]
MVIYEVVRGIELLPDSKKRLKRPIRLNPRPDLQILEAYCLLDRHWLLERAWQNDDIVNAPPFDAISMNLGDLWLPQD